MTSHPVRRWSRHAIVALFAIAVLGCTSGEETTDRQSAGASGGSVAVPPAGAGAVPPGGATEGRLPEAGEFVDEALDLEAASRAELRASLGEPDSTRQEIVPNRHMPGVQDTIHTLYYPGLVARIHHPGGGGDLMSMVQVSSDRYLRWPVIGLPIREIEQALGRPNEASDSSLLYHCTTCEAGDNPVEFVFEDGIARRVRFNYYVD